MDQNITFSQLQTIHGILSEAQERIFDETGHRIRVCLEDVGTDIGPTEIIAAVAKKLDIPVSDMLSDIRKTYLVIARQIAAWLIRRYLPGISPQHLASALHRDRATVRHSIALVDERVSIGDDEYITKLNAAEAAVKKLFHETETNELGV